MTFVRHYQLSDGSYAGSNFGNFENGEIVAHSTQADGQMQLIKFARKNEKDIVLMSFPGHATFNGGVTQTKLSADFPGIARAYIQLDDGTFIYSEAVSMNLHQVVQAVDTQWSALSDGQKAAAAAMYVNYQSLMETWNLTAIESYIASKNES